LLLRGTKLLQTTQKSGATMRRLVAISLVAVCLLLAMAGSVLAAPVKDDARQLQDTARLVQKCLDNPSLLKGLSQEERDRVIQYVTPVSMDVEVVDKSTGQVVSTSTIPLASSPQLIAPMSINYYTIYVSGGSWDGYHNVYVKDVFGVTLCAMSERNTWSWNSSTGKIVSALARGPYVNSYMGWTWVGIVSEGGSSGSYYFQHAVQGHFTFNVLGWPVQDAYPLIDFTDWANSPARITWHGGY
jgi:hypothetical protein